MLCPECKIEARISNKAYVIKGEKLFIRYEYSCRNKQCNSYDKVIGEENDEVNNLIIEEPTEEPAEQPTVEETEELNTPDEEASE